MNVSSASSRGAEEAEIRCPALNGTLESFLDPWPVLRAQAARMQSGDALTVRYGGGASYRLHSADVEILLRLTGFAPDRPRRVDGGYELEAIRTVDVPRDLTCSVVVPCRNEVGNIDELVRRVPHLGTHTQLVFIDGASTDGTIERIEENIRNHPERDIILLHQKQMKGGKGAAVFQAFDEVQGDVIMILDDGYDRGTGRFAAVLFCALRRACGVRERRPHDVSDGGTSDATCEHRGQSRLRFALFLAPRHTYQRYALRDQSAVS